MANGESSMSMTRKFGTLESLCGKHFRRWQMEIYMALTSRNLVYVLHTPLEEVVDRESLEQSSRHTEWENDDYLCRTYILCGMSNALFDMFHWYDTARLLWEKLELKHMEVSTFNMYRVCNFIRSEIFDINLDGTTVRMVEEGESSKILCRNKGKKHKIQDKNGESSNKKSK